MSFRAATHTRGASPSDRLQHSEKLNRPERVLLLIIVGGITIMDLVGFFIDPASVNTVHFVLGTATTLAFALYIWSPVFATCVLGVAVALDVGLGDAAAGIVAASIAAGLVMRLASVPLMFGYLGGFLLSNAVFAFVYASESQTPGNIAIFLVIATISGGVGLALRSSYARGHRLEHELELQAEREREAVLAERRWIAGELHDSIAHHLTIVALHVQLLDDDTIRTDSQEAIRVAARKALSDLRFVIELAEEAPRDTSVPSGDLSETLAEAHQELEAAGHASSCDGDPADERIPRGVEIILARIVRESATNILKYAGPGEVRCRLDIGLESVALEIRSPLPTTPRNKLSSSGTGLNRMAERVLGVKGEFSAGPADDHWLVSARLPIS